MANLIPHHPLTNAVMAFMENIQERGIAASPVCDEIAARYKVDKVLLWDLCCSLADHYKKVS